MQMLLQGSGSVSFVFAPSTIQAGHVQRGVTAGLDSGIQHTGGPYATMVMDYHPLGFATQPLVPS